MEVAWLWLPPVGSLNTTQPAASRHRNHHLPGWPGFRRLSQDTVAGDNVDFRNGAGDDAVGFVQMVVLGEPDGGRPFRAEKQLDPFVRAVAGLDLPPDGRVHSEVLAAALLLPAGNPHVRVHTPMLSFRE